MSNLLSSIKDDLTDRRLLPLVGVVGLVLAGALAYALLGGGSGSASNAPAPVPLPSTAGISVSQAQTAVTGALAETANGAKLQRGGSARNPFKPLPSPTVVKVATPSAPSSGSSGSSASAASGGGSGSSGSATSGTETKGSGSGSGSGSSSPSKPAPAKPKKLYSVAVEFGPLPEAGAANPQLHAYAGLKKPTPLPSAADKLLEFVGVTANGGNKSATFALVGEAILHGEAACHPSQTQCQLITLKEGHTEQMEFLTTSGQTLDYELHVVKIESIGASAAALKRVLSAQAHLSSGTLAGGALLHAAGMRFSAQPGVIVFAGHSASGAHAARRRNGR
jgi:hypothetical protein